MRKKLVPEEKAVYNVVTVYRERGNYLQRLELFEKAIQAYNEALRWNGTDVPSLLGRSLARAKATHYVGALADAAKAAELEPEKISALQIRAQTEYEKRAFERALVLAHRGQRIRKVPPNFAECARVAEETIRECTGRYARKILSNTAVLRQIEIKRESFDADAPVVPKRVSRMQKKPTQQVQELSHAERQRAEQISRLMASKYLERMAHDKYFLTSLCKDERLPSANKQGSIKLQELAMKALCDVENRQAVLRERRPLYAARASEVAARARLFHTRKEELTRAQRQHSVVARKLIRATQAACEERDTAKCLEHAEFAMERISRKSARLLPAKEKYLQQLYDFVAKAFLDQKCVKQTMSECDREKRAFILLGMFVSREPSRDSVLKARPPAPPRDAKQRIRTMERTLTMSTRPSERCYLLHELARLYSDTKQNQRARFFAMKCQTEARASDQRIWLLNASFLLARCHLQQNNRPEARAALIEAQSLANQYGHTEVGQFLETRIWLLNASFLLARCHLQQNNRPEARAALIEAQSLANQYGHTEVGQFLETCVNICLEGEVSDTETILLKREKAMVSLMQDDDLRSAAEHLFRKMSVIPAARRFSIMPGARIEESAEEAAAKNRRISIIPKSQQPTRMARKAQHPLGFQDFDI